MLTLWVIFGFVSATALVLAAWPRLRFPTTGRPEPTGPPELGLLPTALLTGGPGRLVDTMLVDLAERRLIRAAGGTMSVEPGPGDEAVRSPAPVLSADSIVMLQTSLHQPAGLATVREESCRIGFVFEMEFAALTRQRLAVSPLRRQGVLFVLAMGTFTPLFAVTMAMLADDTQPEPWQGFLALVLTAVITTAVAMLRAQLGLDPRSASGLARARRKLKQLDAQSAQAWRVAVAGFAAMTDQNLRASIQGDAPESTWTTGTGSVRKLARRLVLGPFESKRRDDQADGAPARPE